MMHVNVNMVNIVHGILLINKIIVKMIKYQQVVQHV